MLASESTEELKLKIGNEGRILHAAHRLHRLVSAKSRETISAKIEETTERYY
jgi:hypothetical protein